MKDSPEEHTRAEADLGFATTQYAPPSEVPRRGPGQAIGRIDRFILLNKLGSGGMGIVYLAWDPELDRRVAIKVLHPDSMEREGERLRKRLVREAKAMARLSHPNIVPIYESREHDGAVFVVMEYIEGTTLAAWRRRKSRSQWRDTLHLYLDAGRGLAAAHAAGFVHRDFKPENVLLGKNRQVKVSDFGIVRVTQPARPPVSTYDVARLPSVSQLMTPITTVGAVVGTPAYMAPEQFAGGVITAKTDQFSFCVALWEALYGERPYAGDTIPELTLAVLSGVRREPSRRSKVPSRIRRALERGLSTDPSHRWSSMADLLAALETGANAMPRAALYAASFVAVGIIVSLSAALARSYARSPTPAPSASIRISVSPPGATVLLDGQALPGPHAKSLHTIASGPHHIEVKSTDAFIPYDANFTIAPGALTEIPVTLEYREVALVLDIDPADAHAYLLEGETRKKFERANGRFRLVRRIGMSYTVEAFAEGYSPSSTPVIFTGDPVATIKLTLTTTSGPASSSPGGMKSFADSELEVLKDIYASDSKAKSTLTLDLDPPDAAVGVDGVLYPGGSPREIPELSPGRHTLTVSRDEAYLAFEETFIISPGASLTLPVSLASKEVLLHFDTQPPRSAISVVEIGDNFENTTRIGRSTSYRLTRKPQTTYAIEATHRGYQPSRVDVTFSGAPEEHIAIRLAPNGTASAAPSAESAKTATLKIGVNPGLPPATVWVDGVKESRPTVVTVDVEPGVHTIKWKWPTGVTSTERVSVADGESKVVKGRQY